MKKKVDDFLDLVYEFQITKNIHHGMSYIFDYINYMLCQAEFELCDEILASIKEYKFNTRILLTFLTITNAAKDKLSNRKDYYNRAYKVIELLEGKEAAKQILENLG